jgi:hypothetical protein
MLLYFLFFDFLFMSVTADGEVSLDFDRNLTGIFNSPSSANLFIGVSSDVNRSLTGVISLSSSAILQIKVSLV